MINNKKVVAIIPLRGNSKRIPGKNIKTFHGRPLAYWVAHAAKQSKYIDAIHVSTEDEKIKQTMAAQGLNLTISHRPKELAQDTTPEELVHLHFMTQVPFDILVILHATNPVTTRDDIDRAIETLEEKKNDALVTGTLHKRFYWTKNGKPLNYNPNERPRTQDFEGTITENGAFYITRKSTLQNHKNFLGGSIGMFEMKPEQSIDIDTPEDWAGAEELFKKIKGL